MVSHIAYTVHVLLAVLWVGGMAFALMALRPALAVLEPAQRMALMAGVHKRFFLVVWHAVVLVLLTGYWLLFGYYGGFRGVGWHVHLMHLTGIIMAAVYVAIFTGPWKTMRVAMAANDIKAAAVANDRIRQLVLVNLLLGLLTVGVAAWGGLG
jgi:uncharacterized membrane protein